MKMNYDGLTVSFTPEDESEQLLLAGFANLDAVLDSFNDSNSMDRVNQLNRDAEIDIELALNALQSAVANDDMFDEVPPEDEDEDEIPTPVPGSID